jgi:hypothetical protein
LTGFNDQPVILIVAQIHSTNKNFIFATEPGSIFFFFKIFYDRLVICYNRLLLVICHQLVIRLSLNIINLTE